MPRKQTSKVEHSMSGGKRRKKPQEILEEDVLDPIEEDEGDTSMSDFGNLRDLIFLGRSERVVRIENFSFKLTTLSSAEQREVVKILMSFDDTQRLANVRDYTVAQSLSTINGVPFEELCEKEDLTLTDKVNVLGGLQNSIIDRLFSEYNLLIEVPEEDEAEEELKK